MKYRNAHGQKIDVAVAGGHRPPPVPNQQRHDPRAGNWYARTTKGPATGQTPQRPAQPRRPAPVQFGAPDRTTPSTRNDPETTARLARVADRERARRHSQHQRYKSASDKLQALRYGLMVKASTRR